MRPRDFWLIPLRDLFGFAVWLAGRSGAQWSGGAEAATAGGWAD